eukprot:TRINITY_DN49132_c0_g1_i1.p1 TRINITY_DN49132_c0_g1~~TRINITY_DN49132_c0_g1_i1.p1  ORF type:complete len:611 (-),score=124.98 TRINITY_DN49132_c0_g1_i1:47-1849(-)
MAAAGTCAADDEKEQKNCCEDEGFFDVPDPISAIWVRCRRTSAVELAWHAPRDNERPILRYQVCAWPWVLGQPCGPLPTQTSDSLDWCGPGPGPTLQQMSAAETAITSSTDSGGSASSTCSWLLAEPEGEAAAANVGASPDSVPRSVLDCQPLPSAAWVSVRAGNEEGWAEWAAPALVFFRGKSLGGGETEEEQLSKQALLTWGLGEDGRLGRGTDSAQQKSVCAEPGPVVGFPSSSLASLALGSHSAAITAEDELFVWGTFLAEPPRSGGSSVNEDGNAEVDMLVEAAQQQTEFTAHSVACGRFATAVLSADAKAYVWGPNESFQCGVPSGQLLTSMAKLKVPGDAPLVALELGEFHGLALTAAGEVLAWGMEQGPEVAFTENAKKLGGLLPKSAAVNQPEPRRLDIPRQVIAVAAGGYHSSLVTDDGRLWMWGSNTYGQLGLGLTSSELAAAAAPRPLEDFGAALKAAKVALGGFHSAIIDEKGCLWTCGDNRKGQCGQGEEAQLPGPRPVALPGRCIGASCGGFFSLFEVAGETQTVDPVLLACGWGKEGCLGFGQPCKRMLRPRQMPRGQGGRWLCMRAGMVHVAGFLQQTQAGYA